MIMECKRNKDISDEFANELFNMFLETMGTMAENSQSYKGIFTDEFKKNWINKLKTNENEKVLLVYDDSKLAAFVIVLELENETFIQDFHIKKEYQGDGKTFRFIISEGAKNVDITKELTGDIWIVNGHSRDVFKHIGARFEDGKFRLKFDVLAKWLS